MWYQFHADPTGSGLLPVAMQSSGLSRPAAIPTRSELEEQVRLMTLERDLWQAVAMEVLPRVK